MKYNSFDYKLLHICNYSFLLYGLAALIGFIGFAGFWPPPEPYLSAEEIGKHFIENSFDIRIGMTIIITFAPLYLVFSGVISKIIERMEGPMGILSRLEMSSASIALLTLFIPPLIWLTAAFRPESRSYEEIQLMYDFGWLFIDMPFTLFYIQYGAVFIAILRDKRESPLFPRWIAWLGMFNCITYPSVLLIPFVYTGPFAWHGLITFWLVFTIFFVYLLVLMIHIPSALRKLEAEDQKEEQIN